MLDQSQQRQNYYADFGVTDVEMFPLHEEFNEARLPWLMRRDLIHLLGGDPFIARYGQTPVPADLPDLTSLGLVNFEFNPHLGSYGIPLEGLRGYSQRKDITVYGAPDGCGLAVVDGKIECHGPVVCFKSGREEPRFYAVKPRERSGPNPRKASQI